MASRRGRGDVLGTADFKGPTVSLGGVVYEEGGDIQKERG